MADDTQVINLKIKVGAEGVQSVDLVDGKLGHLEGTAGKTGATMDRVSDSFKRMLAAAGAGYTISALTSQFTEYRQELANVQSVAGANADELERLAAASRVYGIDFATGAQKATAAQYALGSAGQSTNEIIQSQQGVMALGAAAGRDMAASSALIASTLSQFNLEAAKSTEVADIYAAAIAGSQANLDRLAISMRYVGPVAANVGQDLRLTTAELMALYNAGFEASQAGTALRTVFSTLLNPTKEQAEALAGLGVSATDAQGELKSFPAILDELKTAGAGAAEIMAIFGQEAGPAMIALVSQGGAAIKQYEAQLYQSGKAADMAKVQLDHLGGDLKRLRAVSEDAAIGFVGHLEPALRAGAQGVIWLIQHGEILVGTLGTAGAAMAVFKAESYLMASGLGAAANAAKVMWASMLAHPFALATAAAGTLTTVLVGVTGALETSEEHWRGLHREVTEAAQAHQEAARELDEAEKALSNLETGLEEAAGDQAKEKEVVEKLNALYPDLAANYDGSKESLVMLKGVLAEYVELRRQESQLKSAEEQRKLQALIRETTDQVGDLRGEWTATAEQLGADPDAEAELAGLSRQAEALWEQYKKLGESKKDFPELASTINEAQGQIVALLEQMVQTSWQASDAPAQVLTRIQKVIEASKAAKAAAEEPPSVEAMIAAYDAATLAAGKRGEEAVKAANKEQAAHDKVADEISRLTQEEYDFKIGQLERWKLRLQAEGKWTEDQQRLYAARRMAIEKDHTEELAKEEKKRTDKAIAEAKRRAAELKKHLEKQAKDEKSYNQLMATIGDKTLNEKQRALAQLEREYKAYYEKLEALSKTDYERYLTYARDKAAVDAAYQADRTKLLKQYSDDQQSAFDEVMAQWADGHKQMAQVTADTFTDIRRMAGDILFDALTEGFEDVGDAWEAVMDSMVNIAAQAASQILTIWAATNIGRMFTGGGYFPLFGSGGAMGAGGFDVGGAASGAKSIYEMISGNSLFAAEPSASALAAQAGGSEWAAINAEIQAGMAAGWAQILAAGGLGYLGGSMLSPYVFGDNQNAQMGANIGAGLGAAGGMSSGFMSALGLGAFAGPWGALGMGALGFLAGGGIGSLFGDENTDAEEALAHYQTNLNKLQTGTGDELTALDLYNQFWKSDNLAGTPEDLEKVYEQLKKIGALEWWTPDPEKAYAQRGSEYYNDPTYWQLESMGGVGSQMAERYDEIQGSDEANQLSDVLGQAAEELGPYSDHLAGLLERVDLTKLATSEWAAALTNELSPATLLQAEYQERLDEGAGKLAATQELLNDSFSLYVGTTGMAAEDEQALFDLMMEKGGALEELQAKEERYREIQRQVTSGEIKDREELAAVMQEARGLHEDLGYDQMDAADMGETMSKLALVLEGLAEKLGIEIPEAASQTEDALDGASAGADEAANAAKNTTDAIKAEKETMQAASEVSNMLADGHTNLADATSVANMESENMDTMLAQLSEKMGVDLLGSTEDVVKALGKGEKGFAGVSGLAIEELSKEEGLIKHLMEAGSESEESAGKVKALAEWIAALQDKEIDVIANVYKREHDTETEGTSYSMASFHTGGHVGYDYPELRHFHTGGLVGALASDEIPAIVKVDEFLVRSERVTPSTLPILEGINRGESPRLGGDVYVSVSLNGDVIGEAGTIERLGRGVGEAVIIALDEREAAGEVPGAPRRLEVRI